LLIPAFAFLASLTLVAALGPSVLRGIRRGEREARLLNEGNLLVLALACIVATLGFVIMEALHLGMLATSYHADELYPFDFLIVGGCFAVGVSRWTRRLALSFGIVVPVLCLAPWALRSLQNFHVTLSPTVQTLIYMPFLVFNGPLVEPLWMLSGAALLAGVVLRRTFLFPLGTIVLLSVVGSSTLGFSSASGATQSLARDRALALYDIASIIDKTSPDRRLPIWWTQTDPNWPLLVSLGEMMYLEWDPLHRPPVVTPGDRVTFLSSDGTLSKTEERLLTHQHLAALPVVQERVRRGTTVIDVVIADIVAHSGHFDQVQLPLSVLNLPVADDQVHIAAPGEPWVSAAAYVITGAYKRRHPTTAYVRVQLRTETGIFGLWLTTEDGKAWLDRKSVPVTSMTQDVYLAIPAQKSAQIVFGNGGTNAATSATVYSISILY